MSSSLSHALRESRASLAKIGDGDWTPQDSAHLRLANAVELHLDTADDRTCIACGGLGLIEGFWLGTAKTCPACHGKGSR